MATFTTFTDILPDPVFKITEAGNGDGTGKAGPGFASMKLRSVDETQVSRTISGRGVHRYNGSHHWEIDINYHPMLRSEFDPVATFIESRGRRSPFMVILPQYARPKDSNFSTFAGANIIRVNGIHNAGSPFINMDAAISIVGNPSVGDMLNILDSTNVNHLKTYKIVRVETADLYQAGTTPPGPAERRVWIHPPLERNVANDVPISFINPRIRVIPKGDIFEYDLNTDNLYSFSLSLEEIQP